MTELSQLLFDGIVVGLIIAISAVGISIVYASLRIVNFAAGDFLTFGAYTAVLVNVTWRLPLIAAPAAAMLTTAALGVGLEFVLWRPLRRRRSGLFSLFVTSIGLALVLRQALLFVAGGQLRSYRINQFRVYMLGPVRASEGQLIALIVSLVVIGLLAFIVARTGFGRSVRALADDADLAEVSGVNTDRVVVFTWLLAGSLAGLAGFLLGIVQGSFDTNLGWNFLLLFFCAVVLGGIGSIYGALLGGLVIGVAMSVSTWSGFAGGLNASYEPAVAFGLLVAILLVRPHGLLGRSRVL
jgi:neutral amino acid transport system permease protein